MSEGERDGGFGRSESAWGGGSPLGKIAAREVCPRGARPTTEPMRVLPTKATLVILTLVALMKAPDAMPAFKNYKVLDFNNIPAVLDFKERKSSAVPIDDEQLRMHPDKNPASYKIFRLNDSTHSL